MVLACPTGTTSTREPTEMGQGALGTECGEAAAQAALDLLQGRLDVRAGGAAPAAIRASHVERVDNGTAER